jgi:hypothetical protein
MQTSDLSYRAKPRYGRSTGPRAPWSDAKGLGRRGYGKTKRLEALLPDNFAGVCRIVHLHLAISPFRRLKGWPNMKSAFRTGYRRPRKSGGPGATAAALQPLDSRFRGKDEQQRNLLRTIASFLVSLFPPRIRIPAANSRTLKLRQEPSTMTIVLDSPLLCGKLLFEPVENRQGRHLHCSTLERVPAANPLQVQRVVIIDASSDYAG